MDPNQTLADIRRTLTEIRATNVLAELAMLADVLASHVENLDNWLSHGNSKPQAWT